MTFVVAAPEACAGHRRSRPALFLRRRCAANNRIGQRHRSGIAFDPATGTPHRCLPASHPLIITGTANGQQTTAIARTADVDCSRPVAASMIADGAVVVQDAAARPSSFVPPASGSRAVLLMIQCHRERPACHPRRAEDIAP
ncbi:MAG: hypothetical protein R3C05_23825 [Pirellulaceae bacterium]